jgi:hypothetical protein
VSLKVVGSIPWLNLHTSWIKKKSVRLGKGGIPSTLKGLSHEILRLIFWPVWMHLGLNVNCLCFF